MLLDMSEKLKQKCLICGKERPLSELKEVLLPSGDFGYLCPGHNGVEDYLKG